MDAIEAIAHTQRTMVGSMRAVADRLEAIEARMGGREPRRPQFCNSGGEFIVKLDRHFRQKISDPTIERIINTAQATYGSEGVATDGGLALEDDWTREVRSAVTGDGSLLGRFDPAPAGSGSVRVPVDVQADWNVTTGIVVAKTLEGAAITASKPALGKCNLILTKIAGLVHASEEIEGDSAGAFGSYIFRRLGEKLRDRVENALLRGTGNDEPLGILSSPGRVQVTASSSTATVLGKGDILAMVARLLPGGFMRSLWVAHSTVLPALLDLTPLYNADGRGPYGTLCGRPVYISEHANPLDSEGDLALVDPSGVLTATQGPKNATTIGFAFDQGLQSFRSYIRMAAVPILASPVARRTGSDTMSHIVTLSGSRS